MINLFNDDAINVLKTLPDKSVDLIVTDPPYEFGPGVSGGCFEADNRPYHKSLEFVSKGIDNSYLEEMCRVMKKINCYFFCNKEQLRQYIDFFGDKGASVDLLTWHKVNPTPMCDNKYLSDTEYILFFREKGVKVYGTFETKRKWYATPTNKSGKDNFDHPTVKPLFIVENLIENSSLEGETVLDCFMGTGTTGVAAVSKGRNFIGVEIVEKYFKTCQQRINSQDLF